MKKSYTIFLIISLLVTLFVGVSCDDDSEETLSGGLPTMEIGEKWVSRVISEDNEYTMTMEVIDEDFINGIDCFVIEASFDPPSQGIFNSMTLEYNKETMLPVRVQKSGEYMAMPFIIAGSYTYEFPGASRYPREVGKEYEVIVRGTTTTTEMGETNTETDEKTLIYKIEKIEEITVPAGTFKCFKEVGYDETGETALETTWYSNTVKLSVKNIYHENGETTELLSYSVK